MRGALKPNKSNRQRAARILGCGLIPCTCRDTKSRSRGGGGKGQNAPHHVKRKLGVDVGACNLLRAASGLKLADDVLATDAMDPGDDRFFDRAKGLALAMIESEGEKNKFFPQTAQGWFCGGMMWEVVQARKENRTASLRRAREWCLQPDVYNGNGDDAQLVKGVRLNAQRMVKEGGEQIASLAVRFAREKLERSDEDVLSTLATETEFLVSPAIARDVEKGDWNFRQLKERPTTVYIVVPPEELQDKRRWVRMLITSALHEHLRPGGFRTLFIFDEFRVSIGHLPIVNNFWSLVRGAGVQFMPVCQSITQLQFLFKEEWPNYAGQAGAVATIGPPGDEVTAKWMSERSGNKTVWQEGENEGESVNLQGPSTSKGGTRSRAARPLYLPQEIRSMKIGTGLIWLAGEGEKVFPYYAPEHWHRPAINRLIDRNPYAPGASPASPAATSRAGTGRGLEIVFALFFLAAIVGGMWTAFGFLHDLNGKPAVHTSAPQHQPMQKQAR